MRLPLHRKIRSFRLRIALLSTIVSGLSLAFFGIFTFAAMQHLSMQRMDKDIKEFVHRHLVAPRGPRRWENLSESLRFFLGDDTENTFILLVKNRHDVVNYMSPNWPQELGVDEFPADNSWEDYPLPPPESAPEEREIPEGFPPAPQQELPNEEAGHPFPPPPPGGPPPRDQQPYGNHEKAGPPGRQNQQGLTHGPFPVPFGGPPPPPGGPPPRGQQQYGGREQTGPLARQNAQGLRQGPFSGPPGMRPLPGGRPHGGPPPGPLPLKTADFVTRETGNAQWRIGVMSNPDITVVLGLNLDRFNTEMAQLQQALWLAVVITLLFVAAGAWWVSQRALKPIAAVTGTIKQIKAKGLDQRIAVQNEDREFSELITVFNDMMDWLEKSFHQAIRFSADASHELKTPLTILQGQLERAVHDAEPGSEEQRRYVALGKELQRLKSITQKLLLLSRIDAGELKLHLRPLNLTQLVEGIVEDTKTLAPQLKIKSNITPDLWIMADSDLMKQVVQNLSSNTIKYNYAGGTVCFTLQADTKTIRLVVENSGRGIAPEDCEKVFTRFFRGDKARTRHVSGSGLGLSIAREIVRAHQGELALEGSSDVKTVFSLKLPRANR